VTPASEALGEAWLREIDSLPEELAFSPRELAALAVRCPTLAILREALSDVVAFGPAGWAAAAFDWVPDDTRAALVEYLEVHEWLLLHALFDPEVAIPAGPWATNRLRAGYDPDEGVLRFGHPGGRAE
jgi:hypothetical protein